MGTGGRGLGKWIVCPPKKVHFYPPGNSKTSGTIQVLVPTSPPQDDIPVTETCSVFNMNHSTEARSRFDEHMLYDECVSASGNREINIQSVKSPES